MNKSVSLHTLGCKLNYSETSTLAGVFHEKGFNLKQYGEKTDLFVLNTCSVTENADKECRQIVRSVLNRNPDTYIIVTGCYAQLQPHEIALIHGVDLVLGSNEKFRLFDYLDGMEKKDISCVFTSPINEATEFDYAYSSDVESRTRAYLKIQDGCDYNCSFCTIPLARGKSRSLEIEKVIDNAKKLIDKGYKEIVLTGVNTGDYNFQVELNDKRLRYNLIDVLYELDKLDIERIRISSIEPNLLTDEIIQLTRDSSKLCNHFHIPLQSGDAEVLKLMRRRYNRNYYEDLIYELNEQLPGIGIGVDVIVGFPGETDKQFENTYTFLESLPISYLHVFTYSERRNTFAVTLPGRVDASVRKERSKKLRKLSAKKKYNFYLNSTGSIQKVLFETMKNDGFIYGFTENYVKVRANGNESVHNRIINTAINGVTEDIIAEGEIIPG
jgi:threonylcarbamoyladenosine tRNA methylthiotransferase MtaB